VAGVTGTLRPPASALVCLLLFFGGEPARQVSQSSRGAYEASLASTEDGFVAAWYDTRHGRGEIYTRHLAPDGQPLGPERRLTRGSASAFEPDVAYADGSIVVAWYEKRFSDYKLEAKLGRWTVDGRRIWMRSLAGPRHPTRNPVVRVARGEVFCAWLEYSGRASPDLMAAWYDMAGHVIAAPRRVAAASRTTWNLNAALDEQGQAWVVFDATTGTRSAELFLARLDKQHTELSRLTDDDGFASKYPDLGLSGNAAALTWFDERDGNQEVYLAVGSKDDLERGLARRARRVTDTPGHSIGAYLAWNGPVVGLAWCDDTSGQYEIFHQAFDATGQPVAPPLQLTHNVTASLIPAIKPSGSGFALVWNEYVPGRKGGHGHDGRSDVVFTTVGLP
jgi:hypothetical protein